MSSLAETRLFKKVFGSVAAANIGSAMGAAVEWVSVPGGGWKAIEERWGWVEAFMPWVQQERDVRYWNNSPRLHYHRVEMAPGMTEDGAELRYLLGLAIAQRRGRITVDDLAEVWRQHIPRDRIGYLFNPHIKIHLDRLLAGDEASRIPPRLIGTLTPWPGLVDAAHMIGPVGIINACDPAQASMDAAELSSLLQPPASGGAEAARVVAAATAAAFWPTATVESVVEAARSHVSPSTREILDEALEIARQHPDPRAIREPIRRHFMPTYPYADGVETAAEAIALFWVTRGEVRAGIIAATNLGRDTDCIAGMLGSICGAFKGIDGVPAEWVETVQRAIASNPYTVQKLSMKELAEGLTRAVLARRELLRQQMAAMDELEQVG